MPFTFVNASATFSSGSATTIATAAFTATAGNLISLSWRAAAAGGGPTTSSITDTAGNTYTRVRVNGLNAITVQEVWECRNCLGNASNVITVTFGASAAARGLCHAQYSNSSAYSLVAILGTSTQNSPTPNIAVSPGIASQLVNGLVVGHYSVDSTSGTWTAGTGTTERAESGSGVCCVCDVITTTAADAEVKTATSANNQANYTGVVYRDNTSSGGGSYAFCG